MSDATGSGSKSSEPEWYLKAMLELYVEQMRNLEVDLQDVPFNIDIYDIIDPLISLQEELNMEIDYTILTKAKGLVRLNANGSGSKSSGYLTSKLENYVKQMRQVKVDLLCDPYNMKLISLKTMLNNQINLTKKLLIMIKADASEDKFLLNVPCMYLENAKKLHMVENELEDDPTNEELPDLKEELHELMRLLIKSVDLRAIDMMTRLKRFSKSANGLGANTASGPSRSSIKLGDYNLKWGISEITTVTAEVKIPSGNVDKPRIEDNGNGTMSIKYAPREEGLHELYVKENGEPIVGSPCKFHAGVVAGAFVHAFGAGLEHGVSGERCNFTIEIKGVDTGCLYLAAEGPGTADILCQENEGRVSVSYLPTVPGWYKISAKFCDETINGSPFSAKIIGTLKPTYALGQATFSTSGAALGPSRSSIKVFLSSKKPASFWEWLWTLGRVI